MSPFDGVCNASNNQLTGDKPRLLRVCSLNTHPHNQHVNRGWPQEKRGFNGEMLIWLKRRPGWRTFEPLLSPLLLCSEVRTPGTLQKQHGSAGAAYFCGESPTNKLFFFYAGLIYIQLTRLAAIYILNSGSEESFMRQTKLILKSGKQQKAREVHTMPFISIHFMFLWRHNYQMLNSYLSRSRFLTP